MPEVAAAENASVGLLQGGPLGSPLARVREGSRRDRDPKPSFGEENSTVNFSTPHGNSGGAHTKATDPRNVDSARRRVTPTSKDGASSHKRSMASRTRTGSRKPVKRMDQNAAFQTGKAALQRVRLAGQSSHR